ncbi:hypothetical protein [Spongiimicrobium sp. 2-473A-2-J]|uniref:hypothetical protein n=1 Tax=Eudoraea algarum TaxID=3417568 RepID=UPI003D360369
MTENRFLDSLKEKEDFELENIIADKKAYVEEARIAAIQILKERKGKTADLESAENEIKTVQEERAIAHQKTAEEEKKKSSLTDDQNAPELHSKRVITVFAGIFSTIFGAVLLMYNMKQTGNQKGRTQVLIFGILYTIACVAILNALEARANLALIFNLAGAGILTEYFWNKFIGKSFKYRKRSWIKPAIISVVIMIPFILAIIYGR